MTPSVDELEAFDHALSLEERLNQTDENGANIELLKAIRANDAALIYTLKARGAVADDQVLAAAQDFPALLTALAYEPGDEPPQKPVTTTTTTSATAQTTTTTTTTVAMRNAR